MRRNGLRAMQNDQIDKGGLKISVVSSNRNRPIANARIEITYTGDPERIVERLITDENGQIPEIELSAPPIEYSMTPSEYQPYSEYDFRITADEFEPITISGAEILPEITALQTIKHLRLLQFQTIPCMEIIHRRFRKMRLNRWMKVEKLF